MKATRYIALALAVGIWCDSASAGNAPHATCAANAYDFGTVASTQTVTHAFTLNNEGNAPLVIGRVVSGCGCTTAGINSNAVPPGSNCIVTVTMTMQGRDGPQHKALYIASNDPLQPLFQLRLTGTIVASSSWTNIPAAFVLTDSK